MRRLGIFGVYITELTLLLTVPLFSDYLGGSSSWEEEAVTDLACLKAVEVGSSIAPP